MRIRLVRAREVRRESHGRDARQHDDDWHEEFEEGGEQDALLGGANVLGGECPLNDVLVEAPVGDVHDPQAADEHRQAREVLVVGIVGREDHGEPLGEARGQCLESGHHARSGTDFLERDAADDESSQHQQ